MINCRVSNKVRFFIYNIYTKKEYTNKFLKKNYNCVCCLKFLPYTTTEGIVLSYVSNSHKVVAAEC